MADEKSYILTPELVSGIVSSNSKETTVVLTVEQQGPPGVSSTGSTGPIVTLD